ncbi:TetR family transcriptional regulator [Jiangella endophytica]|uniref:TetR family transcriptional regulator n=1 Tax=Jiangella endophytica TaxID=1623398 RepID=UPI000E34A2FC|nr:TetR family transcriptional regulator [Jiangella endophytica]
MVRLTRAQTQERTRSGVLAAARAEFAAHGYGDAKIDGIAARAGLTRGAIYANFTGKRALYLSVLAADAERAARRSGAGAAQVRSPREALAAIARARLSGRALTGAELPAEVLDDDRVRTAHAQLLTLEAVVLGLALERLGRRGRGTRVAASALTLLAGADGLATSAPGFADPFDVVAACELLAGLPPDRGGPRPYLRHVAPARPVDEPWPGAPAPRDGIVHVLGLHRLEAAEESVRSAPAGADVTVALVAGRPDDLEPLARLVLARLDGTLRQAIPEPARPPLRLLLGPAAADLAAAAGVTEPADDTEAAVRVEAGRLVARADGRGAGYAVVAGAVTRAVARPA